MSVPVDAQYFTVQARKCRRLAAHADERTAKTLLNMAEEYEAKAAPLNPDVKGAK